MPLAQTSDDPITLLEAWTICAGVAQVIALDHPGAAFVPLGGTDLVDNVSSDSSGLIYVNIFLTPAPGESGLLAVLCHISGTLGNPSLEYTIKTH
jgi:hypothetical protein